MFRLIRILISLAVTVAFVYFAVAVPLGEKTLWEHVRAIAATEESQELVQGVKEKAAEVMDKQSHTQKVTPKSSARADDATSEEQERLRKLIRDRLTQSNPI